jgi:hypothetical protein
MLRFRCCIGAARNQQARSRAAGSGLRSWCRSPCVVPACQRSPVDSGMSVWCGCRSGSAGSRGEVLKINTTGHDRDLAGFHPYVRELAYLLARRGDNAVRRRRHAVSTRILLSGLVSAVPW